MFFSGRCATLLHHCTTMRSLVRTSGASLAKVASWRPPGAGEQVWYDRLNARPTRRPEFAEDWVGRLALAVSREGTRWARHSAPTQRRYAGIVPAVCTTQSTTRRPARDPD